jgi:hypothetical protein
MVTMRFKLDAEAVEKSSYTVEELETKIRQFFAKKNGVEIAPLTFQREDSKYGVGAFANIFEWMIHDSEFLGCISECTWDINGKVEDCLASLKDVMKNIRM